MRFARSSHTGTRALDWTNGEASIPAHEIDMNARSLLRQRRQQADCHAAHLNVLASVAAGRKTGTNCEQHNNDVLNVIGCLPGTLLFVTSTTTYKPWA